MWQRAHVAGLKSAVRRACALDFAAAVFRLIPAQIRLLDCTPAKAVWRLKKLWKSEDVIGHDYRRISFVVLLG